MAERVGFEPTVSCPTPHFECGALDHYATLPTKDYEADEAKNVVHEIKRGAFASFLLDFSMDGLVVLSHI